MDPLLEVKSKTLGTGIQGTLRAYPEELVVRTVHSPRSVLRAAAADGCAPAQLIEPRR
jgi:hypothetical protein